MSVLLHAGRNAVDADVLGASSAASERVSAMSAALWRSTSPRSLRRAAPTWTRRSTMQPRVLAEHRRQASLDGVERAVDVHAEISAATSPPSRPEKRLPRDARVVHKKAHRAERILHAAPYSLSARGRQRPPETRRRAVLGGKAPSRASRRSPAGRDSLRQRYSPSWARRRAVARPMPRLAPVISAIFFHFVSSL